MSCNCELSSIPLTAVVFLAEYDEFACLSEDKANQYIQYACIQYCSFSGLCESDRLIAYKLATAHVAFMFYNFTNNSQATLTKSIKNRDEQITYRDNLWDLKLSPYGQILDKMLNSCKELFVIEGLSYYDGFGCGC